MYAAGTGVTRVRRGGTVLRTLDVLCSLYGVVGLGNMSEGRAYIATSP